MPLILNNGDFFILSSEQITEINQDSIGLGPLTKMCQKTWGTAWGISVPISHHELLGVVQTLEDPERRRSLLLPRQPSLFPEIFS